MFGIGRYSALRQLRCFYRIHFFIQVSQNFFNDGFCFDSGYHSSRAAANPARLQHMQNAIERYLQRAIIRSPGYLAQAISPQAALQRITASLGEIIQLAVTFTIYVPDHFQLRIDEADLYEILSNILDSACKYGATEITMTARDKKNARVCSIKYISLFGPCNIWRG